MHLRGACKSRTWRKSVLQICQHTFGLSCWATVAHGTYEHRQSKEWTRNAGKIANVADATSVMRPDTLYFGTLYLHFKYI